MRTRNLLPLKIAVLLIGFAIAINGCTKDDDKENKPPSIFITSPEDGQSFEANELVTIRANANDSDGVVMQVRYYLNGEYLVSINNAPYTYEWNTAGLAMGDYKIKATADDDLGGSTSAAVNIKIISAPIVEFSVSQNTVFVGDVVHFTDESTNSPESWSWDFGDGTTSNLQNPDHTYTAEGNYTVSLTATNSIGFATEIKTNYITVTLFTLTDSRDGQIYNLVDINGQIWMAENLNFDAGSGNCWYYDDNNSYADPYGRLYDWETATAACPVGWHLPTAEEYDTLINYYGGVNIAGGKLKETGTSHWNSPNTDATNESGFTAVPGGYRDGSGNYSNMGFHGNYWTAEEGAAGLGAYCRKIYSDSPEIFRISIMKEDGVSVRCLKD